MTESREHFALDWIRREIDETLKTARSALEAYAESDHDETKMRACLTYLHQVHGTLLMLELTGVTLLSDEMEQLAQGMLSGAVRDVDGAKQLLMQAILQLPAFLEEIQKGQPDSRRAVLPLANELRMARGEKLFEDPRRPAGRLHDAPAADTLRRFDEIDGVEKARRIRAAYQQVLLSVLKGENRQQALTTLAKVAVGLQRICERTPSAELWRAFAAYVAALADSGTELSGEVVRLLRRVDAEIKALAQGGTDALNRPLSLDLVKQLVDAARAHGGVNAEVEELAAAIDMAPAEDHVAVSKREAIHTAAAALREELASVKDALDLFVRSENRTAEGLLQLSAPLKQIGSTLSILGFESSRTVVADQLQAIQEAAGGTRFEDSLLLGIASALLQVDENLAGIARQRADMPSEGEASAIIGHAQIAVLEEARSGLEQVKQAVVDYVSAQWDVNRLAEVPALLAAVKGALAMVPLPHPAEQLNRCLLYVSNELMAGHAPDWSALDAFADAISGIDYHLERLCENTRQPGSEILDLVERSLAQLGYGRGSELAQRPPAIPAPVEAEPLHQPAPSTPPQAVAPSAARAPSGADVSFQLVDDDLDEPSSEPVSVDEVEDESFDLKSALFDEPVDATRTPTDESAGQSRAEPDDAAAEPAGVFTTAPVPTAAPRKSVVDTTTGVDDDILEIFIEEVGEVLDNIDHWLPQWETDYSNEEALTEVRRAFHTLKGSGRIVGANVIGELAWSIENMLNRVLDETLAANAQIIAVTREGRAAVPALRDAFERRHPLPDSTVAPIMQRADVLAAGGHIEETRAGPPTTRETAPLPEVEVVEAAAADEDSETDALFEREAEAHLAVLEARFAHVDTSGADALSDEVTRALHTLRGSASMAGVDSVARIAGPLYDVARQARDRGGEATSDVVDFIQHGVFALRRALQAFIEGRASGEDVAAFDAEAARIIASFDARAPAASSLLQLDGAPVLLGAQEFVSSWHIGAMDLSALSDIVAALHELRNEAESQSQRAVAALCDALIETYERLEDHALSDAGFAALTQAHERLLEMFDAIAADTTLPDSAAAIDALGRVRVEEAVEEELPLGDVEEDPASARVIEFPSFVRPPDQPPQSRPTTTDADVPLLQERVDPPGATAVRPVAPKGSPSPTRAPPRRPSLPPDADPEILEIFFEEADELLDAIDQCIHIWVDAPDNRLHQETLLRALHTLKGGARLAGLAGLGDEAHAFESFLIGVQEKETLPADFFDALQYRHDELVAVVAALKDGAAPDGVAEQESVPAAAPPPLATPQPLRRAAPARPAIEPRRDAAQRTRPPAAVEKAPEPDLETAESDVAERQAASAGEPREQVRVTASLLEQLVNLAGESSIIRSRVEQGMNDFTTSLEEMETTIERMREQLRRLEIETEAQVLFRQEAPQGKEYEDFDPLEMDRYSQLQQVSRSLSESASDMLMLKDSLTNKAREGETLLLQQARVNTELQEGLMRTRMVPFSRLLPRLRRTVRQVSRDLGKDVDFHAFNAEGELDRNVLERMIPPLEHMLRNAVDHGIEATEVRRGFGKPAKGRVDLRLSREAGDVVIEIVDDGAGIDVESVRAKAIERGLMTTDARLRDEEVLQFVLAPGFSTAKSVTQISGRGVGMDVVHSAVKQLGGSIAITSIPGKGTRFSVRLPFTVSVNRALMVTIGEDQYAVPLNTIEGIVRVSGAELARLYEPDGGGFEYAGVPYRVRYLGSFIGREYVSLSDRSSVPVVLVRSGDRAVAVHVDGVQGSREIVVKSLGPQFAGVGGISGATILGDGSVVVILDLVALIRAQTAPNIANGDAAGAEERPTCVMVVDDSVTVRKVTSRLLERQGMDVMVAKDGVEAMALLQERRPDIMLLDIEMPRMDGFEVARQIRHDDRLAKLPIVMISSRTGAKHQERAVELGVDRFLGKPFQENELLATIEELVHLGND
jgi:chemosensory pili system protein ChpA (sensor histidine kinase/response regulator)